MKYLLGKYTDVELKTELKRRQHSMALKQDKATILRFQKLAKELNEIILHPNNRKALGFDIKKEIMRWCIQLEDELKALESRVGG